MCCDIPPSIQFSQVLETQRIPWIRGRQIQCEAKAFEVLPQVLQVWVAVVERAMGRELGLNQEPERAAHSEGDDHGRFGVKVATIALKVGAE
jgi:hypothetical protein